MLPKKKSRPRSATAQRASSSPAARSGNSVKAKSKKSSESESVLRVRTPKDSKLQYLQDAGIIVPEEIPSNEDRVPLDFTQLSNRDIGGLQSRYAVRHAHSIFNAAKLGSDAATVKRELRLEKAKFRLRHKEEKVNVVAAMMDEDEGIAELESALIEIETRQDVLDAVSQGYADIRDAASREITRRMGERAAVD